MAPIFRHKNLAAGRWFELSLAEQMGNIGSEVWRVLRAKKGNDEERFWNAAERALELFDLTLEDPRWRGGSASLTAGRRFEIARAREVFCDAIYGGKLYKSSLEDLTRYFDLFAYAAALDRY